MRSRIEINRPALIHNFRTFTKLAGTALVAPVLKANAYGHGFAETYRALQAENPTFIGVNYLSEAHLLRQLGYTQAIMVLGPVAAADLGAAYEANAGIIIGDSHILRAWLAAPAKPPVHVKFDTGMSRQGFSPDDAQTVAQQLLTAKSRVVGVSSHFANVEDVTDQSYAERQLQLFQRCAAVFRAEGFTIHAHIASSASTLILAPSFNDIVRVGISLYGLWPSQATRLSYLQVHHELATLKPALAWYTEIASLKAVKKGQFIGYGCTYRSVQDVLVGVLPVGYYEGYPRLAGEKGAYVLVDGARCSILGRICMNMMMIDLTHLPQAKPLDRVTLIGRDQSEAIEAHTLAAWAETIHYELVSRLHHEIPRILVDA